MNGIDRDTFIKADSETQRKILFDMFECIWKRMDKFEKRIWGYILFTVTLLGVVVIK